VDSYSVLIAFVQPKFSDTEDAFSGQVYVYILYVQCKNPIVFINLNVVQFYC